MRRRVCIVTTSVLIVRFFLIPHLRRLSAHYDVTLVVHTDDRNLLAGDHLPVRVIPVAIERPVRPIADLRALTALVMLFRREAFDVVHSFSPKGGLLAMLAACIARVPVRFHTFTGQVWANRGGPGRTILKAADCVTARCATHTFTDSPSQQAFLDREGVTPRGRRMEVLGDGSISGIDVRRFRPDPVAHTEIRSLLGVPAAATLFVFAGRITRDKGILDLAEAFDRLRREGVDAWLVVVGPDEDGLRDELHRRLGTARDRFRQVDYVRDVERYFAAADILCLPSYREGFGVVIIEAAACGLPCVASRIYGISDAVVDGVTGILHPPGDTGSIARAMTLLATDTDQRARLARAARERALAAFAEERITGALLERYRSVIGD